MSAKKIAILVGGGPAPGINGVIRSVTIEALNSGYQVIGILEGFRWLAQGSTHQVRQLTFENVSRIHLLGGSILRTSREAPARNEEKLQNVVRALKELGVNYLVTIGGDDTAYSASRVAQAAAGAIEVVHVPKTIDNDLPLPAELPTFGYQTARQVGVDIVTTLMEDAKTTGRWYFVVAMGRTAGHLALGIGKAASATLTIIPEEFGNRKTSLAEFCSILEGAIIKRKAFGHDYGVAVIAEGAAECIEPSDFDTINNIERDEHGHVRLAELPFGQICKNIVRGDLADRGLKVTVVSKNIGYELRCANPTAADMEYTQDLGYAAVQLIKNGQTGTMACVQNSQVVPLRLQDILDPVTGKTQVRRVDIHGSSYTLCRRYMMRLWPSDFSGEQLNRLAGAANLTVEQFKQRFGSQSG